MAFFNANWGNNPGNSKLTCSSIVMPSNALVSFKVGVQRLTAQSAIEAELVTPALTMTELVICLKMMNEL